MDETLIAKRAQRAGLNDTDKSDRHSFSTLPEFGKAMKKIVAVPKEEVEKREKESRTPRVQ